MENPWNTNAEWWQENFSNGKNKEYSEQLLPLIVELMNGCKKIIDIGAGADASSISFMSNKELDAINRKTDGK